MLKAQVSFFLYLFLFALQAVGQQSLFEHFTVQRGLPTSRVQALQAAQQGHIWVATSKTVSYYNGKKFTSVKTTSGQAITDGIGFVKEGKDVFLYTSSGMIFLCTPTQLEPVETGKDGKEEFGNRIINTLIPDNDKIYVSTVIGGGLYAVKNGSVSYLFSKDDPIRQYSFFCIEVAPGKFAYGSNNLFPANNKFIFQNRQEASLSINLSVKSGYSKTNFLVLENNSYLFSKEHELIQFNDSALMQRIFMEKSIECLFQDKDGKIWIGLNAGGLVCIPSGNVSAQQMVYYLGSKTVSDISEDKSGNIWVATMEDGLFMMPALPALTYSPPNMYSATNTGKTEIIDKTYNLSFHPDKISIAGSQILTTDSTQYIPEIPFVHITGVRINQRDTLLQALYQLDYSQQFIQIHFVGLIKNSPSAMQYKYRINTSEEWKYSSSPTATYSSLKPGEYAFTVFAMSDDGIWSETPAIVTFIIRPPFWQTPTFYVFMLVFMVITIASAWGIIQYRKKKARRNREEMQKRILQSELQALRAQMNPHFTFNTLSSIQNFIHSKNTDDAVVYLSKFAKLMRSIMDNSRKPLVSLSSELTALELYMQLEQVRLDNKFSFSIHTDADIESETEEIPPMLLQPYVENAIWHGVTHKEGPGHIAITVSKKPGMLVCSIVDNGIGREASAAINRQKAGHNSKGMSITKERLTIINAMHNSPLSVTIIDLKDKDSKPAGTRVEIFVPIEN